MNTCEHFIYLLINEGILKCYNSFKGKSEEQTYIDNQE